jgi:hypothetical protein
MKSRAKSYAAVVLLAVVVALAWTQLSKTTPEATVTDLSGPATMDEGRLRDAQEFATLLCGDRFEAAAAWFDAALARQMDARKLETVWRSSAEQRGAFRKIRDVAGRSGADNATAMVACEFEKAVMNLEIRFDSGGRVRTFYLHSRP